MGASKPGSGRVLEFIENLAADSSKNRFRRRIQILSLAWYCGDSTIVPELVTILGVEKLKRSRLLNTGSLKAAVDKDTDSVDSLYGFGHDENEKWTFAGVKPKIAETIVDEKTES